MTLTDKIVESFRIARTEGVLYSHGEQLFLSDAWDIMELFKEHIEGLEHPFNIYESSRLQKAYDDGAKAERQVIIKSLVEK